MALDTASSEVRREKNKKSAFLFDSICCFWFCWPCLSGGFVEKEKKTPSHFSDTIHTFVEAVSRAKN